MIIVMPEMNSNDIELETGLVIICSNDLDCKAIADKIRKLPPIAQYEFQKEKELHITDIYMDRNLTLADRGYALRFRKVEQTLSSEKTQYKFTLKGPSKGLGYAQERLEIEKDWSYASLKILTSELERLGIPIKITEPGDENDPISLMKGNGFKVIQNREVKRKTIEVRSTKKNDIVAELDIDYVSCSICDNQQVGYYNIEIEAKGSGDASDLSTLVAGLKDYKGIGECLKIWPYSKLATIKTIEELIKLGKINPSSSHKYELKPSDFSMIERVLNN
jgi:hypothetical protein